LEDKKVRIMELKKKIQELEKFKFVLDYKINELRREVDPRNVKILELNEKATKMKSELKHFNRVNGNLTLIVEDMRMRQEGLKKELCEMRK
jgi:Fe-S-cluster formation regulator IscX/YfhJ